ncbi:hypothetical protein V1478_003657 [Vespula squamosa]|uniref:Uncharacterized protein n=1 Tax=Vespula squamosa TaxID=30214 RepID=A0ABD2BMF1_VESSQ
MDFHTQLPPCGEIRKSVSMQLIYLCEHIPIAIISIFKRQKIVSVVRRLEYLGRVDKSKTRIYVIFLLKSYVRRVVRIINTLSANSVEEDLVAINIVMVESVNLKIHPLHLYQRISSGAHHAEDERSISARVTGCIRRRPMSETSKSVRQGLLVSKSFSK